MAIEAAAFHRRNFDAQAFEKITVDNTVGGKALTSGTFGTRRYAYIQVETAPMRFRIDGGAPTTTDGHLVNPGDAIPLDSNEDITAFRAIRTTATNAVIQVTYSELKITA